MTEIKHIYDQLKSLQEDIRKLGPKRRKEAIGQNKLQQAKLLYNQYIQYIDEYSLKLENSEISVKDSELIQSYRTKISDINNKILLTYEQDNNESATMTSESSFDLKTAVSLLPTMDGSETVTKQLIDAIELYSSMIKDADSKLLINFVLKTRLTQSAKLRISDKHTKVSDLVDEMKFHLLPVKSATAIQTKLMTSKQGQRSIERYGQELEELFVNLTVTQANGKPEAYSVLKPLNEKTAISRFTEGLRNEKLGTIIASRNYTSLKDAIQGAKDQEVSVTPTSGSEQMFYYKNKGFKVRKPYRGHYKPMGKYPQRYKPTRTFTQTASTNRARTPNNYRGRRQNPRHQVNTAIENEESDDNLQSQLKFFRA